MSGSYRSMSAPEGGDDPKPMVVRLDPTIKDGLRAYALSANTSMNVVVNEAVAHYLARPEVQGLLSSSTVVPPDAERLEAVVRRLSGEDS